MKRKDKNVELLMSFRSKGNHSLDGTCSLLCLPFIEGSGDRGGLLPQKDICNVMNIRMIVRTRSYAALRAADLDWIVRPGYRARISKNVTEGGSQLTWEGGRAGINKNVTYQHRVTTDQGRGDRAGINKNVTYQHGVTTDLLDV